MPSLDGLGFCRQIREDPITRRIPVIFVTSKDTDEDEAAGFAAGGVDYIVKPTQFDEVQARITTHLKLRRLQLDLAERNRAYEKANQELHRLEELRDHLAAASKFGMWWTYYQQFDCQAVEAECRKSALDFLHCFGKTVKRDAGMMGALANRSLEKTVEGLQLWANDSARALPPDDSLGLVRVLLFLTVYRNQIESQISQAAANTEQTVHPEVARRLEGYLRWRGHFPRLKGRADPQEVMERACRSQSIVVVGDIRRSQDLMTYAVDEQDFSRRMVEFIVQTRSVLTQHGGFFDKFTGDGFLGYFNETICGLSGSNYMD